MNRKPSRCAASTHKSDLLLAGFVAMKLAVGCGDTAGDRAGSVMYVPPAAAPTPAPALTGTEQHAAPQWPAPAAAGAAAPVQPIAASPPPAPSMPALTPPPPPASATPALAGAAGSGAAKPASGFEAGSGMLAADGKTVIFHIADGTGGKDWNPKDKPIRVQRGMTLRLIDDDKSTRSGGHWLHTNGQPCPHGLRAIGTGFDCVIGRNAPYGVVSGTFEHNVANGLGRIYIEVVNEASSKAD
jgi:hypothetical protein